MKKIIITTTVVALLVASQSAYAASSDYVNYWTMDEGMGQSVNDSVGGQNGVMTGTSTGFGWASGKVGTAVGMDGAIGTGIALPDGSLSGSQGTLSLWLDAQAMTYQNIIFSGKSTSDNNIYAAFLVDSDGRPTFQYRDSTNGNDNKAQGATLLNKNEWYNLVLTADGKGYHMYVNGEEIVVAGSNSGRWFPDITNQKFSYRIGTIAAGPLSGSWNGYLDDVRIYARPLTSVEVKELFATTNEARSTVPAMVAPKVTLTISNDHIPFGGAVNLMWKSVNTDTCAASGSWNGPVATSGSMMFEKLAGDSSYTLSCGNAKYGTDVATVKVMIGTSSVATATSSLSVVQVPPAGMVVAPVVTTSYTRNLTVGSRGDDVKQLQNFLIGKGYLGGSATGYFGGLTKAALVKLQKELGLPAMGYFGPMTRAALSK